MWPIFSPPVFLSKWCTLNNITRDPHFYGYRGWRSLSGCQSLVPLFRLKMTSEVGMVFFLHNLTSRHQNKTLPQEDGPRTKTSLMNIIEQFPQCAALGVKMSQNTLFLFFIILVFMGCLKIIIFQEGLSIPGAL